MRDLHLLAAPLLVLMLGVVWSSHASPRLRGKRPEGRRSGICMLLLFLPMALSGYLLQTAAGETDSVLRSEGGSPAADTALAVGALGLTAFVIFGARRLVSRRR